MTRSRTEIKDLGRFIHARRRATVASEMSTLPHRRRHVSYLTQSELAELVGVSDVVISQIEQGRYPNLNASILKRISHVLGFHPQDDVFAHGLLNPRAAVQKTREPAPAWLLQSVADTEHPVILVNAAYDLLGWNVKATEMLGEHASRFFATGNAVKSVFQLPEMKQYFMDWDEYTASLVSGLRMSYGVHANYRDYVVEFAHAFGSIDPYFLDLWNQDDPLIVPTVQKDLNHPDLGHLQVIQVITVVVEAPELTMAEFLPATDESHAKLASLSS